GLLPFVLVAQTHSLTLCVHSNVLHYFLPVVFGMSIISLSTARFSFLNYDNFPNHHLQNSTLVLMFLFLSSFFHNFYLNIFHLCSLLNLILYLCAYIRMCCTIFFQLFLECR